MSVDTIEAVNFSALDRCDRCDSQALTLARRGDLELMFCNHHRKEHETELLAKGFEVIFDSATYEGYSNPVAL